MSESQRYELCSYVNLMKASTLLLINPILGLQPDYTEDDLEEYIKSKGLSQSSFFSNHKKLIVGLCNMLYSIWIDDIDIKLLTKSLAGNKEFLKASNITKSEFNDNNVVDKACKALDYKKKERKNMSNNNDSCFSTNKTDGNEYQEKIERLAQRIKNSDDYDETTKENFIRELMDIKEQRLNIMITGGTGCGKSSTINALFNAEKAKIGTGPDPETMDIKMFELNNINLWDTPGLGDGEDADERHKKNIIKMLHETNEKGEMIIDLVLVIIDGSNRDMGTAYNLINNVIIPNLGENPEKRILIAINKADAAKLGREWDYEQHKPMPKLIEFLDEKAESVRARIKNSTGIDVETIYYSAGYKEEDKPQEPSYNLLKLLLYIVRFTPAKKRPTLWDGINTKDEEKSFTSNDKPQEELVEEIAKELSRVDIFKQCFSTASNKGAEIGANLLGVPGKVVGATVGAMAGAVWGGLKSIFHRKKK